jgi:hypothetical protein
VAAYWVGSGRGIPQYYLFGYTFKKIPLRYIQ